MLTLQGIIFIEFDVNTKKITFLRKDNIIDYDSNATSVYVRVKYKDLSGNTTYLTPSELEGYKFSLYTIKPATKNFNEITGKVTDELEENTYGGVVKFEIPRVCTNKLGIVKCEIHINQENKMIASSTFVLDVKQSLVTQFDDALLGDEDLPVLKQLILEVQNAKNIDDNNRSKTTSYSSDKIETIKEDLTSQINAIGEGITSEQIQQLSAAYEHSQSTHAPSNAEANVQVDWNETNTTSDSYIKNKPTNLATIADIPTVPTKTSQLINDSNFVTDSVVDEKISNAQLNGGEVDLSSYAKKTDLPTKISQLTNDSGYITNVPDEYITETELNAKGYVTTSQMPTVPTNVSAFTNDANYASETFVTNKITEAQLGGDSGTVDLSGYVTKETGNANQITFADGQTFQTKLNNGTLKGDKGDKGDKGEQGVGIQSIVTYYRASSSSNGVTKEANN